MKNFRDRKWPAYRRSWAQVSKLLQTLARSCLVHEVRSTAHRKYSAFVNQRAEIGFEPINLRYDGSYLLFKTRWGSGSG